MWDVRPCSYEGERVSKVLNIHQESMFRWWRRNLKRELYSVLGWSLGLLKWVGFSQCIREVTGEYVWIDGEQDSYLQYIRKLIKKDLEADVYCLEWAMGSPWW